MIHHIQNLEGRLGGINTTNTNEDDYLDQIEREAYEHGNMTFRNWTDSLLHEENNNNMKLSELKDIIRSVNETAVSDSEIEDLIAKAVKKPSSEVDLDAIEKGEELKEGAGVATILAIPVLLELASKLANKIYRKLGLNEKEAKLYRETKKNTCILIANHGKIPYVNKQENKDDTEKTNRNSYRMGKKRKPCR